MTSSLSAKLARYAVVGFLTLAIYMIAAKAADQLGLAPTWQASLAFISAVVVNYLLQRSWVFADSRPVASSLPRYVVMISIGYAINLVAVEALASRIPITIALLLGVVPVVISNALLNFLWVFLNGDAQCIAQPALKKR